MGYDVLVLVLSSGNDGSAIGESILNRVKDWLRAGGTLTTIADASGWATGASVGLLDTQTLLKDGRPDVPATTGAAGAGRGGGAASPGSPAPSSAARFDLDQAIQPDRERPE